MASQGSFLQQLDSQLEQFLASWNIYTTLLAVVLVSYLVYPLFFTPDPDTHPLLLARQATASPVRQPGESAIYRALDCPHGYPLRSGLNVKDPGAPKWAAGRDGDIRDIWNQALKGKAEGDAETLRITSVIGKNTVDHNPKELMKDINAIGEYFQSHAVRKLAICLPNSVEFLSSFFAAAFYGLTPILIPQGHDQNSLATILQETRADGIIVPAGIVPVESLFNSSSYLKHIIFVVAETSKQMDWKHNTRSDCHVTTWHDVIEQKGTSVSSNPPEISDYKLPTVISVWQSGAVNSFEILEFTQKNLIAAVAAQISTLPRAHRLQPSDLVLSLDSISHVYPLTITLAALFSNASVALVSSARASADFDYAFIGVSPTVVVATAETMSQAHKQKSDAIAGFLARLQHSRRAKSFAAGTMPRVNAAIKNSPRLTYISFRAGSDSVPLTSAELIDLRILTGSRIIYALSAAKVAGAVAQTNLLDYRLDDLSSKQSHFGPPLSCLEIKLVETPDQKIIDGGDPVGEVLVSGPAVIGGHAKLGVNGIFREDSTLAIAT